ncbi:hypothetical protein [Pueribacillus sp. YX66]|uniref:hypothetical protein n=1 Tax=Pueribacillus sp. YX66 TaxID=3229242 RepID=UPI00358D0897
MEKGRKRKLKKIAEKEKSKGRNQPFLDNEKNQLNDNNRQTVLSEQVRYDNADDLYK